jgi:hypothetical protein
MQVPSLQNQARESELVKTDSECNNVCVCRSVSLRKKKATKKPKFLSQIKKAPLAYIKELLEKWAEISVCFSADRYDLAAETIKLIYRRGIANQIYTLPEPASVYIMYLELWASIEMFFKSGRKRSVASINRWLDTVYDVDDFLKVYHIGNWDAKNKIFLNWLAEGFNSPDPTPEHVSVQIISGSVTKKEPTPEWDPFAVDEEPATEKIVPEKLIQLEQNVLYNEFADESDHFSSDSQPELNETISVPHVEIPTPKKRRLNTPPNVKALKTVVKEKDLDSDREGVYTGYVSLADEFISYTSPPGYPYVVRKPAPNPDQKTPLEDVSFNFPSRSDFVQKKKEISDPVKEAEKYLKNRGPEPIKLQGGMQRYVPPHMRQVRNQYSGRGWSNWCCRNIDHYVYHRGAGMIEHRYVLRTGARIPLTPWVSDICKQIGRWCYQHARESTHPNNMGGGLNIRMRAFFNANANRGGAMRSTRAVGIRDIEALSELLSVMYQDDLSMYGSDPLNPDDDHYLQALHVLVPEHEDEGGCDWKSHQTPMGDYTIISMKSKNNNCGIACLLRNTNINKQQNTIRRECGIPLDIPLTYTHLKKVAKHIHVGFRVWEEEAGVLRVVYDYKPKRKNLVNILHNNLLKHYSVLEFKTMQSKCTLCGHFVRYMKKHKCNPGNISFYNQNKKAKKDKVALFYGVKDEPRNLNQVYVFDLETFPEKNNIHVPYACKVQNVGTKQEWLKWGEGIEVMEDIYELSKTEEPCVFIAHNLARFDGSFLLNYLLSKGVKPEFVINGGRILSLKWFNSQVWDTYLFIADSLKNIAQTFKCKVQKGDFDHNLIKTWQDVEHFKDTSPGDGMGWQPYLDCDVYSLREIVELYSTNVYKQFGVDVFNYVTLSSMTYKLWGAETVERHIPIETPQNDEYEFIKDSVYGGRVFPMHKEFATNALTPEQENDVKDVFAQLEAGTNLEEIKYDINEFKNIYKQCWESGSFVANMDMNSLYPTAMCMNYPVGIGEWSNNPELDFRRGTIGIYHIKFKCPKNIIMAVLPQRNKTYIAGWGKGNKVENKRWKASGIKWSLEDGEGVYTSIDIQDAIKQGYTVEFQSRAYIWRQTAPVFENYIKTIYKIKKEQDLLAGTPEYNEIIRMIAKNMMNSLYGKTCQRPIQDEQRVVKTEREFYEFAKDYQITDYVWVKIEQEMGLALSGSPVDVANTKPSHLGAFVLAYSRQIMMADFRRCTNNLQDCNFTYTDTDSIHMSGSTYKQMLEYYPQRFGPELGQFSNDIKGIEPIIIYEHCLAPKCYMYVYLTQDGKLGFKKKVKGIPKKKLHEIGMHDFVNENKIELNFDSLKKNMFNKKEAPFTIENVKSSRTFLLNKWNKMLYSEVLKQFRPFGYDGTIIEMDEFLHKEGSNLVLLDPLSSAPEPEKERGGYHIYATGVLDRWFGLQAPALGLKKDRLVKWVCEPFYDNGKPEKHNFSKLNVNDMLKILEKNKEDGAYLYEVTEGNCRLYCDIDKPRDEENYINSQDVLNEVIGCIKHVAQGFGVIIETSDFRILSACTLDKISFHITVPKHIFKCPNDQKQFWLAVDTMFSKIPLLSMDGHTILDLSVYHTHRALRTIFSKKVGKENILFPMTAELEPLEISTEQIEEYFIVEPTDTTKPFSKLTIELPTNVKKSKKSAVIIPIQSPRISDLPEHVQEILEKNKEKIPGINIKIGKQKSERTWELFRDEDGMCEVCKRKHEKQAGFIFVGKKSYYRCWQDVTKTNLYLS